MWERLSFVPFPCFLYSFQYVPHLLLFCFLLQSAQSPFFYAALSFHLVFSPTYKHLFLLAKLSNPPGLLAPQPCLHLICYCFNSVPPPRTKRFLYKSALALYKLGWYKGWRESQQKRSRGDGAQSSKCDGASADTRDAAITARN